MDEPPDMTAGVPEPPDDGANEPNPSGDEGTPNEEFYELFSQYEYPSHEFGEHRCCGQARNCRCAHGSQQRSAGPASEFSAEVDRHEASVLGLEALDTEFEAARYSEPEWEYGEPRSASAKGELNEFFTPYAHRHIDSRYGQGIGYRRRHPRSGYGSGNQFGRQEYEDETSYEVDPTKTKTKTKTRSKPVAPVISPLATAAHGLRKGARRSVPVFGVCVHTTSGGPANKAKKDPRRSALQRALDFYIKGSEGFPHYVIAYDGSIIATCDENQIAWHAGFGKADRAKYKTWTAPKWWSSVWNPKGARSPLDLFPKGAVSANSAHIGVEMLADTTGYGFTNAQYAALAKLVVDIARRYKLPITSAPSARLLGHEDVHPFGRQNKGGGWDPGAHRDKPRFSWSRLWSLIKANP